MQLSAPHSTAEVVRAPLLKTKAACLRGRQNLAPILAPESASPGPEKLVIFGQLGCSESEGKDGRTGWMLEQLSSYPASGSLMPLASSVELLRPPLHAESDRPDRTRAESKVGTGRLLIAGELHRESGLSIVHWRGLGRSDHAAVHAHPGRKHSEERRATCTKLVQYVDIGRAPWTEEDRERQKWVMKFQAVAVALADEAGRMYWSPSRVCSS